ncbi:hypothetical protein Sm713_45950 [Streptomyces sp. TS71-3]|nr:hypothetical protein Sm713_45950 [Streptomyces sp. TS71-3]
MKPVRYVALGDSLTEGVGDPVDDGWRGWAALLATGLGPADAVEFHNLAVSGARTLDVLEEQTPAALALRPDLASVIIGVNDTLRSSYDIDAVAAGLSRIYAAFAAEGVPLVTACLPDPGAMLGLPRMLARPLARRQRSVNTVVHALSEQHGAFHLHLSEGEWITDRAMWSADRLHPGERGHRMLARRVHQMLADAGLAAGPTPPAEPERAAPSWAAKARWLATKGTAWVVRRSKDLLPQLLALAAAEVGHRVRGTAAYLDEQASRAVAAALAAVTGHDWGVKPGATKSGAVKPGAVTIGAVLPGAVSPAALSPGAVPPMAVPSGATGLPEPPPAPPAGPVRAEPSEALEAGSGSAAVAEPSGGPPVGSGAPLVVAPSDLAPGPSEAAAPVPVREPQPASCAVAGGGPAPASEELPEDPLPTPSAFLPATTNRTGVPGAAWAAAASAGSRTTATTG